MYFCTFSFLVFLFHLIDGHSETVSKINPERSELAKDRRYLLYEVNLGEGMNLRRDVYMRAANLVRQLREAGENWILVLPPWGAIYHWKTEELGDQQKIPWSLWFDLPSLSAYVPVIELDQFLIEYGKHEVPLIYYLQGFSEGWGSGWKEKWEYRPCIDPRYYEQYKGEWKGWFWGYEQFRAKRLECISVMGHSRTLIPLMQQKNNTYDAVMIDRFETVMHDRFGEVEYWRQRRSMRYSKQIILIADQFRQEYLNSNDEDDGTVTEEDWTKMKVVPGQAKGGPYLAVHWRRKDFIRAHPDQVPSIKGAATQIIQLLKHLHLTVVFIATDAPKKEIQELEGYLPDQYKLVTYSPPKSVLHKFLDGGIAIIDQWICVHARYFIGSHVSTFSFRIQDDREIVGFHPSTTFNRLCPDNTTECEQPAKWTLVQ